MTAGNTTFWVHDQLGAATVTHAKKWDSPAGWVFQDLRPAAADLNGDGRTDLAVMQAVGPKATRLWRMRSTGSGFEAAHLAWHSGRGDWRVTATQIAP
nr:VCBS repeat-containing protein [Pilimelia terevasa]